MSENRTLHIHTQLTPETIEPAEASKRERRRVHRRRHGPSKTRSRLTASDRLLRNSAIACAVLLGVLALGNIRQPWAQKAVEGIEQALTMHINLDESLGQLSFVKQLMPESALVFLNVSGGSELASPVSAPLSHPWSALQPWMLFDGKGEPVSAAQGGTVTAVSSLSGGQYGLLIDHGQGMESVYAGLSALSVQSGDAVSRGQLLGSCGDGLYFELRSGGESVDPTQRLGLR